MGAPAQVPAGKEARTKGAMSGPRSVSASVQPQRSCMEVSPNGEVGFFFSQQPHVNTTQHLREPQPSSQFPEFRELPETLGGLHTLSPTPPRPRPEHELCPGGACKRRSFASCEGPPSQSRLCPPVCFQLKHFPPNSLSFPRELIICGNRMGDAYFGCSK